MGGKERWLENTTESTSGENDPHPQEKWLQAAKEQIKLEAHKATYDQWIKNTWVHDYLEDGDKAILEVGCETQEQQDWLESRVTSTLARLLGGLIGKKTEIKFVLGETKWPLTT